jgi:GlcNAc-P-P-Und epimerase
MPPAKVDFCSGLSSESMVLVTGGSGFIGTNLVASYRAAGVSVANADIDEPRNSADSDLWARVDVTRADEVRELVAEVRPTHVFHLAARTDLLGERLADYAANVEGVGVVLAVLGDAGQSVSRLVVTSSRMVCKIGYQPRSDDDYCPPNAYGASKVETERSVRRVSEPPWVLARPTSIWGPWFDVPYRDFFLSVARGRYVHPVGRQIRKSFGFVGNTTWQLHRLLTAPHDEVVGRTFYLADDPPIEVKDFADRISAALGRRPPRSVPLPALTLLAHAGDLVERTGRRAPLTRFRLANLLTEMLHDPRPLARVAGPPPYDLDAGIGTTVDWLRHEGLVDLRPPGRGRLPNVRQPETE